MITFDHEQLSPEWFACRLGIPSASNFDKIITSKGTPSKQRDKYLYKLAGEYVSGMPEDTYQNAAMARGCELESDARQLYQIMEDVTVEEVGFCVVDGQYKSGASPDGLVGSDGLIEIKCPNIATHVGYLLAGYAPTEYFQQMQGQLFVTGRQWVDFFSYYPTLNPLLIRVHRDEKFIAALEIELRLFCEKLEEVINKIK